MSHRRAHHWPYTARIRTDVYGVFLHTMPYRLAFPDAFAVLSWEARVVAVLTACGTSIDPLAWLYMVSGLTPVKVRAIVCVNRSRGRCVNRSRIWPFGPVGCLALRCSVPLLFTPALLRSCPRPLAFCLVPALPLVVLPSPALLP